MVQKFGDGLESSISLQRSLSIVFAPCDIFTQTSKHPQSQQRLRTTIA